MALWCWFLARHIDVFTQQTARTQRSWLMCAEGRRPARFTIDVRPLISAWPMMFPSLFIFRIHFPLFDGFESNDWEVVFRPTSFRGELLFWPGGRPRGRLSAQDSGPYSLRWFKESQTDTFRPSPSCV